MWGAIAAALVGAFLGSVIGPLILNWWFKPRILVASADDVLREQGVLYHRLAISNEGKRELVSCVGSISIIDIGREDVAVTAKKQLLNPEDFRRSAKMENELLRWATLGHGVSQTINPKVTAKLDLYRVLLSNDGKPELVQLPSEHGWEPIRITLRPRALPYNGTMVVSGANTEPRQFHFQLVTDEDDVRFVLRQVGSHGAS